MGTITWTPEHVRIATIDFTTALATTDPAAEVASCPGWTVRDLVAHLGNVHTWAADVVASGDAVEQGDARPGDDLSEWYADRAGRMVDVLLEADPDAACWNFAGVHETTAFWFRRQTHEVRMHLVDLDLVAGRSTMLLPEQAADAISETFEVFGPRLFARGVVVDLPTPVSLVATDSEDAWTLTPVPDGPPQIAYEATSQTRLVGDAGALWRLLWRRGDPRDEDGGVRREGDADAIERLLASKLSA